MLNDPVHHIGFIGRNQIHCLHPELTVQSFENVIMPGVGAVLGTVSLKPQFAAAAQNGAGKCILGAVPNSGPVIIQNRGIPQFDRRYGDRRIRLGAGNTPRALLDPDCRRIELYHGNTGCNA